jgi:hypothetical protein
MRPTPEQVAVLLIAMIRRVGGKRGSGTRWRVSDKTIRKVSARAWLRATFRDELEEELAQLGYTLIPLTAGGYALIETAAFDSWPRVSTRDRLEAELAAIRSGDAAELGRLVDAARGQFVPSADAEADGDDED